MAFKPDFLIDLHWLNKISSKLELFKRTGPSTHVYECRCPICGDSKKHKFKTRLHFYERQRALNAHCKNCGYSHSFYTFMQDAFPHDFEDYKKDQLKQSIESLKPSSNTIKHSTNAFITTKEKNSLESNLHVLKDCIRCDLLDDSHHAKKYLMSRSFDIKMLSRLYYTDNFKREAERLSYKEISEDFPSDERVIIPFFSDDGKTLELMQGRSLNSQSHLRYITIKSNENVDKIFGKNNIDSSKPVYCVEGPLDSLFIDNCLATADSTLTRANADVYIWDNEPRNKDIVRLMSKAIDSGKSIVIWPISLDEKIDINDLVNTGLSRDDLMTIIEENVVSGAKAKLKFFKWRKV